MNDVWYEVLVVILSIFLAIFLVLGIILISKMIQIAGHINRITEHAERMAERAEHVSDFFEKTSTSAAVVKLVSNFGDTILNKRSKK